MTKLEATPEQWSKIQVSDYCLVHMYVRTEDDVITRAWVESIGTREECEACLDVGGFVIVPTGLKVQYDLVKCSDLAPPIEQSKIGGAMTAEGEENTAMDQAFAEGGS